MGELGKVNFEVFNNDQIQDCSDRDQIKNEIIEKLPKQHKKFKKQILPYIEQYLNNDILDNFFKNTLKTPITKIYSSHYRLGVGSKKFGFKKNTGDIEKILKKIIYYNVFNINTYDSDFFLKKWDKNSNIQINSSIINTGDSVFIIALKKYIWNLINLLKLLKDNEEIIKNIYALVNNQHIRVNGIASNHKLLPEERRFYRFNDTNVTAKELKNIQNDDSVDKFKNLLHSLNDITLEKLKIQLKLFQVAYDNIEKFINDGDSDKYSIKDIKTYIDGIKKSQTDLIGSLQDINGKFDYTAENPNSSIFIAKIDSENNIYENILNLLRDITANEALLEQINNSKKHIKIYLDHHNKKDVKVIDLVEANRDIDIDKQLKAFNNSQFSTSALSTLSTSFENIQSKLPAYLNNIIIIIIFLIFLNLFITTYFYFTTSIQATANRSNCGGASLCEAETHRHLFLEDNGNDKARDIYIIIVVIFSIYLLSEIFKSYKDGIDFTDITFNYIFRKNIVILCFIASVILIELAKFYFVSYDKDHSVDDHKNNHFLWELHQLQGADETMFYVILGISCFIFGIGVIHLMYNYNQERQYYSNEVNLIYGALFIMLAIILGYDISKVVNPKYKQKDTDANGNENTTSKGFESTNFNSKFKAKTAIDIILITFYGICILVFGFGIYQQYKGNNNNDDITLYIIALSLLAILLVTLYIFILNSSVDWSRPDNTDNYDRYFEFFRLCLLAPGVFPGLLAFMFKSKQNIIKLIVFYYAILFIIYLFYVYFINHNNESGILSLAYFQLYNYVNIQKNKTKKGSVNRNYYKEFNHLNVYFVVVLLIILIGIGGLNKDPNLDNIIYGIIVFILASYITGIVYLLYNTIFPIQQASFNYKKNLVDINNEISQHIKVELEEHTIDKNKIRVFKIANENKDIEAIHKRIKGTGKQGKEMHMKNIRDIFSEISPKGSSYEDYRSQSIDQMQYEEYIYLLFNDNNSNIITQYNFSYYSNSLVEKNTTESNFSYEVSSSIAPTNEQLYNQIILNVPNTLSDIDYDIEVKYKEEETAYLSNLQLKIPKTNNIEYVIKKNYKYVTGEEGVIQKYNVLSDKELNCLYYKEITEEPDSSNQNESGNKLAESIKAIKNIKTMNDVIITNIATVTTYQEIYKLNQDIFDHYKTNHTIGDNIIIKLGTKKYENITHSSITSTESTESTEYDKLNPAFYTIGYDYENYTYNEKDHQQMQQMNKDTAYSIPARYYACSYLNYFPNEDGSMSKVKFAKNINEDNYNPLNAKNTIIDRIAKRYDENAKETKIQLAPEKFQFLLVFLVILAIILLMFLFNIIKKYFTGDVYTPQMYVLGILGVFLTIFIFGEVIFARIK